MNTIVSKGFASCSLQLRVPPKHILEPQHAVFTLALEEPNNQPAGVPGLDAIFCGVAFKEFKS